VNHYETLGIGRDADKAAVKRAYFTAVKAHSPDADPEGFKLVRLAYETLSDDKKRAEYDSFFEKDAGVQAELLAVRELLRQHKVKQALDFLTALRARRPESADAALLMAETLLLSGKSGKAAELCDELLAANPDNTEALLLKGEALVARGYSQKAMDLYQAAVERAPGDRGVWLAYANAALKLERRYLFPNICEKAMEISRDVFREDYLLYLVCAVECARLSSGLPLIGECLAAFCEYFESDKNPQEFIRENALRAVSHFTDEEKHFPYIERVLKVIEKTAGPMKDDGENSREIQNTRNKMAIAGLRADKRIHGVLFDMTEYFLNGETDRDERLGMESYIVGNMQELRKSIRVLRDEYPRYFKLNMQFYLDVLNERKAEYLTGKYYAIYRRLLAARNEYDFDDDFDDDLDEFDEDDFDGEDEMEPQTPFVRETRKIGRNEPCPCGSGKKYKMCCGRGQ